MTDKILICLLVFMPIVAAFIKGRGHVFQSVPRIIGIAEFAAALALFIVGSDTQFSFFNLGGLSLGFAADGFRRLYVLIAAFMWMMTLLFSKQYFKNIHAKGRYYTFNLITLGATVGVFLAADLAALFLFFEVMSLASFEWVVHEETPEALSAGNLYLYIAVFGGMSALMGIFIVNNTLGTLNIASLYEAAVERGVTGSLYAAGLLMLLGFGAKAGMFPLHMWMPKAHPVAPAPASALLSGVLTKTGIFGILVVTVNIFRYDTLFGTLVTALGVITMLLGAVKALLSDNLKRTLACSSISQIGFILVGIGMMMLLGHENGLAMRGTLLHMVNHSLIKLCLFMLAGVVFMNLHELNLNKIRGYGRKKPLLMFCFLMGALGIGGVPLFNGYISKTLLHESIVEYYSLLSGAGSGLAPLVKATEWLFIIAGGITIAYMTKLFVAVFVEKNPTRQAEFDSDRHYMTPLSSAVLAVTSVILPVLGLTPYVTMNRLAEQSAGFMHGAEVAEAVNYFSGENLKGFVFSLVIGAAVYLLVARGLLMKKSGDTREYISPRESRLFAKICSKALDGVVAATGFICSLPDRAARLLPPLSAAVSAIDRLPDKASYLMPVAKSVAHGISDLPEAATLVTKKTVLKERVEHSDDPVTSSLAYKAGHNIDRLTAKRHAEWSGREHYAELMVRAKETIRRTSDRIAANLSLSLLALTAGIVFIFIYLLLFYFQ